MSILVRFSPAALTAEKHEEVNRRLDESGGKEPEGRQLHVCFGEEGNLRVSEVWDSEEAMQAFGERLMPILAEVGVEMAAPPEVFPVVDLVAR